MTPLLSVTRGLFVAGFLLTVGTGLGLFLFPADTADYWAWTIGASPTAAMFGAGYLGAAVALGLAARTGWWERARIVALAALTLTSLALLATLVYPEPFAFGDGGWPELVAWVWLVVYIVLPPAVLAVFVLQKRAGAEPLPGRATALPVSRVLLGGAGVALGVVGGSLLVGWDWASRDWPWPLPPLPAAVVGAWLCTYAAGLLWFAVVDPGWDRARIIASGAVVTLSLNLVAALRLWDSFRHGDSATIYVGATALLLAIVLVVGGIEGRRLRRVALR